MNKIFQIARYDFKRLVLNPISLAIMAMFVLVFTIVGATYKIPSQQPYSASTTGSYTRDVYTNFLGTSTQIDSKPKLNQNFQKAKNYLLVQETEECFEFSDLESVNKKFQTIKRETEKFKQLGNCIYTDSNNISTIEEASTQLQSFINTFAQKQAFESKLILTKSQFTQIENFSKFLQTELSKQQSISVMLENFYKNLTMFEDLNQTVDASFVWQVNFENLKDVSEKYITTTEIKLQSILNEMQLLYTNSSLYDTKNLQTMKNLITNYKFMIECSKSGVEAELYLMLANHSKSTIEYFNFSSKEVSDLTIICAETQFHINNKSTSFVQYQSALNFNKGSYQTTAFDFAYFVICIISLFLIAFAIYSSYKLFGVDRKNGKVDLILAQNVSFNQVFIGKFLAIMFSTLFYLGVFAIVGLVLGAIFYSFLPNSILAVFNLSTVYTINPFAFFLIKLIGIELQVMFFAILTIFLMNISRKFNLMFVVSLAIFGIVTICNIFLNGSLWYCLLPFIHIDLTSFLGGATMQSGFLVTALYNNGNFFISLTYFLVFTTLLSCLSKRLFKKN